LLTAGAAEGDVEVAVRIEGGVVDLVQPRRQRRGNLDERGFPGRAVDANRRPPPLETRRYDRDQRLARRPHQPRRRPAYPHLGHGIHGKAVPGNGHQSSLYGPQGMNGGDTGAAGRHVNGGGSRLKKDARSIWRQNGREHAIGTFVRQVSSSSMFQ
jgi:hypothetical protein